MSHGSHSESGLASMLFLFALAPVLLVMLAVTLEFSHLIGVRDYLRNVLDEESYDALVYHRTAADVEVRVRKRLEDRSRISFSVVQPQELVSTVNRSSASASANLSYKGTFLAFLENFLGRESAALKLSASARARRQQAGVLIVLDRSVPVASNPCETADLDARATFVDSVVSALTSSSDTIVQVGVFPGEGGDVDLLLQDGSDGIDRCRAKREDSQYDARGLMARVGASGDAADVSSVVAQHVSTELFGKPLEYRAVVLVLGASSYPFGYSMFAQQALSSLAETAKIPLNVLIVVAGVDRTFAPLPPVYGLYGGVFREVGASLGELQRERLASALSRAVLERIVWEH